MRAPRLRLIDCIFNDTTFLLMRILLILLLSASAMAMDYKRKVPCRTLGSMKSMKSEWCDACQLYPKPKRSCTRCTTDLPVSPLFDDQSILAGVKRKASEQANYTGESHDYMYSSNHHRDKSKPEAEFAPLLPPKATAAP